MAEVSDTGSAPGADPEEGEQIVPWDVRILSRIDAGVDGSIIEENLRRTPTERLERHQQMLRFVEETQRVRRPASP